MWNYINREAVIVDATVTSNVNSTAFCEDMGKTVETINDLNSSNKDADELYAKALDAIRAYRLERASSADYISENGYNDGILE